MTTVSSFTSPAAQVFNTDSPTVSWNISGGIQTAFEMKVFSQEQYSVGGFDPNTSPVSFYSGIVPTPTQSGVIFADLRNGGFYRAYVRVAEGNIVSGYTWGAWNYVQFQLLIYIQDATHTAPAAGSTVNTSRPTVNATVAAKMGGDVPMRRVWNFATDVAFTQNLNVVTEGSYSVLPIGPVSFLPAPARLPQGTWYARVRTNDVWGNVGNWSPTVSFTVTHAPTPAQMSPTLSTTVLYQASGQVSVAWSFTDPDIEDFQSKYQVEIWKVADPVNSKITSAEITTPPQQSTSYSHAFQLNATWKNQQLQWRVRVADRDGVWSSWSAANTFFLGDAPVVTITNPVDNGTVGTPVPTITWNYSSSASRLQTQYRVTIRNLATGIDVATSGWLNGTATSWAPSSPVVVIGAEHRVTVEVYDSANLYSSAASEFMASFTPPTRPNFTVDDIAMPESGGVILDWTGATKDATWVSWRIYRRNFGSTTWKLVKETTAFNYTDYTCPSGVSVEYAVVQVAVNPVFGGLVESAFLPTQFIGFCDNYLIVVPDNPSLNVKIDIVTSDDFNEEYEQETLNLIGRGRRVEVGTRYGVTGTISAQIYDGPILTARQKKIAIDKIRDSSLKPYLRNPFGDVWSIGLMAVSYSRIAGVGTSEYLTVSIEYSEVEDV